MDVELVRAEKVPGKQTGWNVRYDGRWLLDATGGLAELSKTTGYVALMSGMVHPELEAIVRAMTRPEELKDITPRRP